MNLGILALNNYIFFTGFKWKPFGFRRFNNVIIYEKFI